MKYLTKTLKTPFLRTQLILLKLSQEVSGVKSEPTSQIVRLFNFEKTLLGQLSKVERQKVALTAGTSQSKS